MLIIFLLSFITSQFPWAETLPKTQSARLLQACLESRVLVGQHAVLKQVLCLSPPVSRLTSRAVGYIELLWPATCSTWLSRRNSCLCLHPSDRQVLFSCCRTKMNKRERFFHIGQVKLEVEFFWQNIVEKC